MDLWEIRERLAEVIGRAGGVRAVAFVADQAPTGEQVLATVDASEPYVAYFGTFGEVDGRNALASVRLAVTVWVQMVSERAAAKRLDEVLSTSGPSSIPLVIRSDRTLGGMVSDTVPVDVTLVGERRPSESTRYLTAQLNVEVKVRT
jgi:hypothetical protein